MGLGSTGEALACYASMYTPKHYFSCFTRNKTTKSLNRNNFFLICFQKVKDTQQKLNLLFSIKIFAYFKFNTLNINTLDIIVKPSRQEPISSSSHHRKLFSLASYVNFNVLLQRLANVIFLFSNFLYENQHGIFIILYIHVPKYGRLYCFVCFKNKPSLFLLPPSNLLRVAQDCTVRTYTLSNVFLTGVGSQSESLQQACIDVTLSSLTH